MRISRVTIKDYRSILNIEDFQFLDENITCFIGPNGSGKSNILRAIAALLDDQPFNQQDYFEKEGPNKILIEVELNLGTSDYELLGSDSTPIKQLMGIVLSREEEDGGPIMRTVQPVVKSGDHVVLSKEMFLSLFEELQARWGSIDRETLVGPEDVSDIASRVDGNINTSINKLTGDDYSIDAEVDQLIQAFSLMEGTKPGTKPKEVSEIEKGLVKINNLIALKESLDVVMNSLTIELLDFTKGYEVKDEVDPTELKDNTTHPFLFDLLALSGKSADDFIGKNPATVSANTMRASARLSSQLNKYWPSHRMNYMITFSNNKLWFGVKTKQEGVVGLKQLSDGEKWYLRFYTRLAISKKDKRNVVWLFDEPGRDLHTGSQIDLKKFFEDVASDSQIIYTTHQPMMIPWHRLERIFVVNNVRKGSNVFGKDTEGSIIHSKFWTDAEENGKLVSPLQEVLGLFVGEELLTGKEHIIVEGVSDYLFLTGWLRFFQNVSTAKLWKMRYGPLDRTVIPAGGWENIPMYALFLAQKLGDKIKCVSIPDSKITEQEIKKKYEKRGLMGLKEKTLSFATLVVKKDLLEIEGLFEPSDYIDLVKAYYLQEVENIHVPDDIEIPKSLNDYEGKITLYLDGKFTEDNNEFSRIDKIGIAKYAYYKLSRVRTVASCPFSESTKRRFEKVLKNIDKQF